MTTQLDPRTDFAMAPAQLNMLANGGFERWDLGTTISSPAQGVLVCPGWVVYRNGAPTFTVSRESSLIDSGLYSAKLDMTVLGGCTSWYLAQEFGLSTPTVPTNPTDYRGKTISLSVRVKSNALIQIWISDTGGSTIGSTHTGDNTWQTLIVTRTISASTTYILVNMGVLSGASVSTTYFDSAMMVVSSAPSNFVPDVTDMDRIKSGSVSDLQRNAPNILANGGFEQWDYGTSFVAPVSNTILADKWRTSFGVAPTFSISQEASVIDSGLYSLKWNLTNVGSCTGIIILQYLDNPEFYVGKTLSLSVRVKTNQASCIRARLYNSVDGASYSQYHTGDNTWQTLTVVKTLSVANLDISIGMYGSGDVKVSTTYIDSAMLTMATNPISFAPTLAELEKVKSGALSDLQDNTTNLLTNGGLEIWQRGTSFSSPANAVYLADKWRLYKDGAPTFTVSKETSIVDQGGASCKLDITVFAGGSNGMALYQQLENYKNFAGLTMTVSARIKTSTANLFHIYISDGVTTTFSVNHSGSGNWETITATQIMSGSLTKIEIGFGSYLSTQANGTMYTDSIMLITGTTPISYVPLHPSDDLIRCQRYYEASNPLYEGKWSIVRNASVNSISYESVPFVAAKSANPTMTISGYSANMYHTPVTGNGVSAEDHANWPLTPVSGLQGFYLGSTRSTDQTTYSVLYVEFAWTAEVL